MKKQYRVTIRQETSIDLWAETKEEAKRVALESFCIGNLPAGTELKHYIADIQLIWAPQGIEGLVAEIDEHFRALLKEGNCGYCDVPRRIGHDAKCPFIRLYDGIRKLEENTHKNMRRKTNEDSQNQRSRHRGTEAVARYRPGDGRENRQGQARRK